VKKRVFSFFLAFVLMIGLLPAMAQPVYATEFTVSDAVVDMLKEMEGFGKYPYWDYGHYTVGYGTTCPEADYERYKANGITEEEADALLRQYLDKFGKSIMNFAAKHGVELNQNKFDALMLFTYNVGTAWMLKDGTFRSAVINGATGNDFLYAIGQWCKAGGNVRTSLIRRRLSETNMYFNGVYSRTVPENYSYVIYEAGEGESSVSVQCYDATVTALPLATATREGYTFAGWFTMEEGGNQVTLLDANVRNTKLYARWIEGEVSVPEVKPTPNPAPGNDKTKIDPVTITVTANGVNIRKGPGTNYGAVTMVYSGRQMTITEIATGSGYTWGKFDTDRWIALSFTNYKELTEKEEEKAPEQTVPPTTEPEETAPPTTVPEETVPPTTVPEVTVPPTTVPEETAPPTTPEKDESEANPAPSNKLTGTVKVNDFLRIRKGAGTGYAVAGYLKPNEKVEILETKKVGATTWGRISKGWISLDYVVLDEVKEETKEEVKEEQKPAVPETTTPPAAPEKEETTPSAPATSTKMTGKVKVNDFLRIRKGAGTGYAVAGYLKPNEKVEILETKKVGATTWGRISKGWISLDYVVRDSNAGISGSTNADKTESKPATVTKTVKVSDLLRIRSGAGTNYKIVGVLYNGAKVEILETKTVNGTQWGRITKGWICMDYVV